MNPMFLAGVRTCTTPKCLQSLATRIQIPIMCNGRSFHAEPSTQRRTRRNHASKRSKDTRRVLPGSSKEPPQRFQQFGRAGGEGEAVAAGILKGAFEDTRGVYMGCLGFKDAVEWLEQNVVLSRRTAQMMLERDVRIAEQSLEDVDKRLQWFRDRLELNEEITRKLVVKRPSLLCKSVEDKLEPLAQWLQDEFVLDGKEVGSMVSSAPNLLQSSIESLNSKIEWLARRLAVTRAKAKEVITACPFVLTNGIDSALEPRLQWMNDNLSLNEDKLRDWILANPQMIGHGVWNTLVPTLNFYEETIGLDRTRARNFLVRNPLAFNSATCLHRNHLAKQVWLGKTLGVTDERQICDMLRREPRILNRTNDRLEGTLAFLQQELGARTEDVRIAALEDPWVLLAGVQTMWMPRITALSKAGVQPAFRKHWKALLSTQHEFDSWVRNLGMVSSPTNG